MLHSNSQPSGLSQITAESEMYIYELRVIQQPIRARMCGFGEKDRRPCTPPPILQLFIFDRYTRQPVNIDKVDASFFTATCSLYSLDMGEEMDLIRQRTQNDSGHGSAYAPHKAMRLSDGAAAASHLHGSGPAQLPPVAKADPAVLNSTRTTVRNDSGHMDDLFARAYAGSEQHAREMSLGQNAASSSSIMSFSPGSRQEAVREDDSAQQCIVRNLIGSSVTAGMKLVGMDGLPGIFFVFPDLSIRKDGEYRLRFSFFNLQADSGELITTVTQIKAHTFSEPFKVYSAKQFPGMIESTELSKHFAKQGVKIPVRKESIKSSDF